jgi:hypothetical protein
MDGPGTIRALTLAQLRIGIGTSYLFRLDVYGYDPTDPAQNRVAVYSVHTIVHEGLNQDSFLKWVRQS